MNQTTLNPNQHINRRNFLRIGLGATATGAFLGFLPKAVAETCGLTPPQTPGPFYPGDENFTADNDLTRLPGRTERALGQVVYIQGKVLGQDCGPIAGANVEIWQAAASGRYNHGRDPNPAPLDPNFRYWGEIFTDNEGNYSFCTIIPGAYPAGDGWSRPPHIHVRVAKLGFEELVTQMYFKGHPLNERDLILLRVPASERDRVVVDFQPAGLGFEPNSLKGEFDLTLKSVR